MAATSTRSSHISVTTDETASRMGTDETALPVATDDTALPVATDDPAPPVVTGHASAAGAQMSVETVHFDANRALVKVEGELDMSTSAPLWALLESHLSAGRRFLRLDMSGVTFLDASALTGIASAHQDLLTNRGTLVITGVRSLVARILRLTGLDEVLFVSGPRADDDIDDHLPAAEQPDPA